MAKWTQEEDCQLMTILGQGLHYRVAASEVGRSEKACELRARVLGCTMQQLTKERNGTAQAARTDEAERLRAENSALKFKIEEHQSQKKIDNGIRGEGYSIDKYNDPETPEQKWRKAEEENSHRIEIAKQKRDFTVTFDDDWVMIAVMSDLHIAPGTPVDMRRMREDAELIRKTDRCFAVLGGDVVDNHIKHRSAVMAARSQPNDQWQHFEYLFEIMAPKVTCAVAGNHDLWSDQIGGVDVLGRILSNHQNTGYSNNEARVVMKVGGQSYDFAIRHQYRMNSSFNQTHAVKQWLRNGEQDFDIGIIGHHHEAAIENFAYKGLMRWAARPGAYQITSSYSAQYGWNDAVPTCPTFVLRGDCRKIYGFPDIRDALEFRGMK